ncbi:hypothetical protein PV10_05509 [Exophiala mesophila]|uniref:Uncharacterized protein n=1 Tax=Exophiala mesophila TaxID=212818 RepID=A0A0D1Z829_EXOME|nr:uncharacterized protein PV10_05509 [Exophiala mesophila]KIV90907.1 hypothetical protein PV10_05509 [Exophiala mesophila]
MEEALKAAGIWFIPKLHHDSYPFIDSSKADLSGKSVLISGASKGIGRATAISFAKGGASKIAILARSDLSAVNQELLDAAKKAGRAEPKILQLKADVCKRAEVEQAAQKVAAEFGTLDILINNAGYLEGFLPMAETDPDEWWYTFEINVKGVYLMTRSFLPLVLKSQDKTIVSISSVGAHLTTPGASSYQTTKSVLLRLNDFLQVEYGDQGLLAYGIHPGGVATELAKTMPEYLHASLTDTPELAGDTLVFLTQERREWLADRYVMVNWDMQEFFDRKDEIVQKDLLKVRLCL